MRRRRFFPLLLALTLTLPLSACAAEPNPVETPAENAEGHGLTAFADLPGEARYAGAVSWCVEEGLMRGVSPDRFDPEGTLTRAMVATILYRAKGEPAVSGTSPFADAPAGQWYSDAVVWANGAGIVRGYGKDLFGTDDPVTKEQLNVMLRRYGGEDPAWTGDPALAVPVTRAETAAALYEALGQREEPI